MHIVIFGLTISSSWGNGHATLWRSLVRAMLQRGHTVAFYEKTTSFYADTRDLFDLPEGAKLVLYTLLHEVQSKAKRDLDQADLAMCTSFCPDGVEAHALILESRAGIKAFYDLDTPVTLDVLFGGGRVDYLPASGLADYDVVLSYTGGRALEILRTHLGARNAVPLYGSVDPENHHPAPAQAGFRATLSYLGTYAPDRQQTLSQLFLEPAAQLPKESFLIGGAQYPQDFPWRSNIGFVQHVPPAQHPAFFSSCRATLNVTRGVMARYGYCPSCRLFEAAACGAALLTDEWDGLDTFFEPGSEILPARSAQDVIDALALSDRELRRIAEAARERVLADHTGLSRVLELESICDAQRHARPELAQVL